MSQFWRIPKKTPAALANNSATKKPELTGLFNPSLFIELNRNSALATPLQKSHAANFRLTN